MDLSTCLRTNSPTVINEIIDGEAVIINLDTGHYYSLDKVGADIWSCIEKTATLGEIVKEIGGRHLGNPAEIEQAVTRLIDELQREDLIVFVEARSQNGRTGHSVEADGDSKSEKPRFVPPVLHKYTDMQDLLLLDPIHEVDEAGWPSRKPDPAA